MTTPDDHRLSHLDLRSEMGQRMVEHDWAATGLGDPTTWPERLRTAVGVCLSSRFPMLVVWGPDLVQIYDSDGLVERRGEGIDLGLDRLRRSTERHRDQPVQRIADALVHDVAAGDRADDLVLVVKRMI